MKRQFKKIGIALIVSCVFACKASDDFLIKDFLESCYLLPYDPKTEMTDVTLIDAYYTNEVQIKELANEVMSRYETNLVSGNWNDLLADEFKSTSMNQNANIQFFRERVIDDYYRLDMATNLTVFSPYAWGNGQFTNTHPFLMAQINVPPRGTNNLWTLYAVQPSANHVSIQTAERPLLFNEGFYLSLFGIPPMIRMNVILHTADPKSVQDHNFGNNEPDGFRWFKPDEKRLAEELSGKGRFGSWTATSLHSGNLGLQQLSIAGPDGVDRNQLRVIFDDSNPQKKYLAYIRDPNTDTITSMFAWDYDTNGIPIRFLKIDRSTVAGSFRAWAQYIIHVDKTTNVDWSLFNVDVSKFSSVYDQRGKYPIQTVNGKVVFDASKDKYAPLPGTVVPFSWFDKITVIRIIILTVFLLPLPFFIFSAIKKRKSK